MGKTVSLYIDNQAVISALSNPKAVAGQHLVRHLISTANRLGCRLVIHWISSHSKVKGNEKVDGLAKEAAEGRSNTRLSMPHILRSPVPTSASATKQRFHSKLNKKWEAIWEESDRRQQVAIIDDNFPFNSFRKRTYLLSRNQASLMTQIRCGHIPLNAYLSRIGKSDTEFCQACLDRGDGIQHREKVNHFLFECPSLAQEREILVGKVKMRHLNLHDLMEQTDRIRELASFIGKSGRLLRFSLLPFTRLFPILFLSVSSSYPLITIYRLLVCSNAQYAYLCTARLLMHSSLTHAQHAQLYCTVYKDSMDILFL